MPKELTLKPRRPKKGQPTWHDVYIFLHALEEIAKGKNFTKMAVPMAIAEKVVCAEEEAGLTPENLNHEVTISLTNTQSRILWKEIEKLSPEQYGRNALGQLSVPSLAHLNRMLHNFARQLDQKMPEPDED